MAERASDRWVSIALSVVLHGALVAAVVYGFWRYHTSRPPAPTLAIEAVVVDPRSLSGAAKQAQPQPQPAPPPPAPAPAPAPAPVEPTGPPEPTPEELAQREQAQKDQERKEQADREAAEQRKLDEQKQQEQEVQRQAEEKRQELKKREEQKQAAEARKRADEQRLAEQKRQEEAQREADAKNKAELEAELKRSLAAEEHSMAARSSGALASWQAQITARIQHAWLRPPSARTGIECVLYVTQVPGGEVVNVRIGTCNGDQAVRESIEAAAYRASPLPPPPDPSLFERNLEITFKPD
ncbi:MAG: cell envelope integrity protein TolA [Steroidobacteraceae bacterium]